MPKDTSKLESSWKRVTGGEATEDEVLKTIWLAGKVRHEASVDRLIELLGSKQSEVRYYALSTLVFDLCVRENRVEIAAWSLLADDESEHVRSMAATSLGVIHSGTRNRTAFVRMKKAIAKPQEVPLVRGSAYHALFSILGVHPRDWPLVRSGERELSDATIDWDRIAGLEAETTDEGER
jgi:hypothetical protein